MFCCWLGAVSATAIKPKHFRINYFATDLAAMDKNGKTCDQPVIGNHQSTLSVWPDYKCFGPS